MTERKKISIITPSYNQGQFIKDTIESVLQQNYSNVEHIIIDGGSTDNTLEILKTYTHLKWISEKDKGAANAINKGFKMSTGDILTWLNSDDFFEKNIFQDIVNIFNDGSTELVIGNLKYIDLKLNTVWVKDTSLPYTYEYLLRKSADIVKQPSTFFSRNLLLETGELDENLKLVFDYDLFVRMLKITTPVFLDKNLVYQRTYDETLTNSFPRRQAFEIFKVSRRNGGNLLDPINLTNLRKLIFPDPNSNFYQFFKKLFLY